MKPERVARSSDPFVAPYMTTASKIAMPPPVSTEQAADAPTTLTVINTRPTSE
jgi:hypothetical protein